MGDKEKDTIFDPDKIIEAVKVLQGLRVQHGILDDACDIDKEILKKYLEDLNDYNKTGRPNKIT